MRVTWRLGDWWDEVGGLWNEGKMEGREMGVGEARQGKKMARKPGKKQKENPVGCTGKGKRLKENKRRVQRR